MSEVLIVDDDYAFSSFARRILEDEGLSVAVASSGGEGLAMARASLPALILLDLGLGDTDGFEVLKALKSLPGTAKIPVVICSITKEMKDMRKGLDLGAADVMPKPLSPAVVPRLKELIGARGESA